MVTRDGTTAKERLDMIKIGKKEKSDQLYKAILQLKDEEEC